MQRIHGKDDIVVHDRKGHVHVPVSSGSGLAQDVVLPTSILASQFEPAFGVGDLNNDGTVDIIAEDVGGLDVFRR